MLIPKLGKLYVGEFGQFKRYKIIYSPSSRLIVDGALLSSFATDLESDTPITISSNNHLKRLNYYIGITGKPKKVPEGEKVKQIKVISKVKSLHKLGRI